MHENSWIFWRKSRGFVEHCKLIVIWRLISIWQVKISILPAKFRRLDQKGRKIWIFWDFLIKISLENGLFHNFLLNISWSSASFLKVLYSWKKTPDFYNNFSDFGSGKLQRPVASGGAERRNVPPSEIGKLLQKSALIFKSYILSDMSKKFKKYLVTNVKKVNFP